MKKEIFILHGSEIVRCGLATIIRKYFNIDITQISKLSDLKSFTHVKHSNIILLIEAGIGAFSNVIHQFEENNVVSIIAINNDIQNTQTHFNENSIGLKTPNLKIQEIISDILRNSENHHSDSIQSGELTTREKDVLKLVALGNSNKDIADQLYISIHTVISHRKNITEKLGIKSISGLTVYAILNKLIDTDNINIEDLI